MAAVHFDTLVSIVYSDIEDTYVDFGSALTNNWRMFKVTNNTDGDMIISLNGTTDNMFVPAGSFTLYDLATNAPNVHNTDSFVMAKGTQFSIRWSTEPTTGDVWLEGVYATGV
jgi:hypothetical protein